MDLELPKIEYKYPENGSEHPLDINSELKFFIDASGFSYLSAALEPFKDPYNNKRIKEAIPMGYKAVTVNERLDVLRKGKLIKRFEEENDENLSKHFGRIENKYAIYSNKPIPFEKYNTHLYHLSKSDGWSYYDLSWDSRQEAFEFCVKSYKVKPCLDVLVVCRVISHTDWH